MNSEYFRVPDPLSTIDQQWKIGMEEMIIQYK